jgi:8-oxo-dGTP pyrophosphatase MutT (NUDIX family)
MSIDIPDLECESPKRIAVRAVFLKCIDGQIYVLMGLHRSRQCWMFPGGGIEKRDERRFSPQEGALERELREELGLKYWRYFIPYDPIEAYTLHPWQKLEGLWI